MAFAQPHLRRDPAQPRAPPRRENALRAHSSGSSQHRCPTLRATEVQRRRCSGSAASRAAARATSSRVFARAAEVDSRMVWSCCARARAPATCGGATLSTVLRRTPHPHQRASAKAAMARRHRLHLARVPHRRPHFLTSMLPTRAAAFRAAAFRAAAARAATPPPTDFGPA